MSIYSNSHGDSLDENDEHLLPSYWPDWDRIHLNGELDFPVDATMDEVYEDFRSRAAEIGAIVERDDGDIVAHPGMAPSTYRLIEGDDGTVAEIWTEANGEREHADVDRLIDIETRMKEVVDKAIDEGAIGFGEVETV